MLCLTFLMTVYLGFRLGTSSEYRDFAPGAAEQLAARAGVDDGKLGDAASETKGDVVHAK